MRYLKQAYNAVFATAPQAMIIAVLCINLYTLYGYDLNYAPYITNEWLINYEGGFVRRGLIGQFIINAVRVTEIDPWVFVYAIQAMTYILISLLTIIRIKKGVGLAGMILLISPLAFLFDMYDPIGLGRKELLFILFMAINGWFLEKKSLNHSNVGVIFYAVLSSFMVIGILIHESFFFYLPLIFLQLSSYDQLNKIKMLILPVFFSILTFALIVINKGDASIVDGIVDSLSPYTNKISCISNQGAICYLGNSTEMAIKDVVVPGIHRLLLVPALVILGYSSIFLAAFYGDHLPKMPAIYYRRVIIVLAGAIFSLMPLFLLGIDYGRWLHVFIIGLFFALPSTTVSQDISIDGDPLIRKSIFILIFIFSISWNVPHVRSESLGFGLWSYTATKIVIGYEKLKQ